MTKFTKTLSIGPVTLVEDADALAALTFTDGGEFQCETQETPVIRRGFRQVEEYLAHKRMIFTVDYHMPENEEFLVSVLEILKRFPYGETYPVECVTQALNLPLNEITRKEIADAVELNPLPILIPCHRLADEGVRHAYPPEICARLLDLERTPLEI